jgi:hypothetical protein
MKTKNVLAAIAVVAVAVIAAVVSFNHIDTLALQHGYSYFTAALLPFSVDGLIVAASLSLMAGIRAALSRFGIGLGVAATLAANVAYGVHFGIVGALVGAWPAVAFVIAAEILVGMLRHAPDVVQDVTPEEVMVSLPVVAPEPSMPSFVPAPVEIAPSVPELPVEPVQDDTTPDLEADTVTTPEAPVKTTTKATDALKKASRYVARNPDITSAELATKLGVSQRTAQRHLVALREA